MADSVNPKTRKPWTRGEKVLLGVIIAVVAVLGGGGRWWHELNVPPVAHVPNPTLPSPNAFDYFVHAGAQMKDEKATGDALSAKQGDKTARVYTDAERSALVAENAPMLATLREGLQYTYYSPPLRSFDAKFPYYAKFRAEARVLALDAQVKAAQGDYGGAIRSQIDAMQMGVMVSHGSVVIGDLVGRAIEAIGRRHAWSTIDRLSEADARSAARRLDTLLAQRTSYADVLLQEKWLAQASMIANGRTKNNWQIAREYVEGLDADSENRNKARTLGLTVLLAVRSKRRHFADYTDTMDALIAQAKRPYDPSYSGPPKSSDLAVEIIVPVFLPAHFRHLQGEMEDSLFTAAVALRAYHARHNDYPTSLDALVRDGILTRIPTDPFAPALNTPLGYRRNSDRTYTLYSVGPDGRDDGGKPVNATQQSDNTKPRYFPEKDDKGDWVVGVNTYHD